MDIQVLVEPVGEKGFRASALTLAAEGRSRLEAIQRLEELLKLRLAGGAIVETIQIPNSHPALKYAGTWDPDDPAIEAWKQAVEDYRRQVDEAEGIA